MTAESLCQYTKVHTTYYTVACFSRHLRGELQLPPPSPQSSWHKPNTEGICHIIFHCVQIRDWPKYWILTTSEYVTWMLLLTELLWSHLWWISVSILGVDGVMSCTENLECIYSHSNLCQISCITYSYLQLCFPQFPTRKAEGNSLGQMRISCITRVASTLQGHS